MNGQMADADLIDCTGLTTIFTSRKIDSSLAKDGSDNGCRQYKQFKV
jgi:hypothetical protein